MKGGGLALCSPDKKPRYPSTARGACLPPAGRGRGVLPMTCLHNIVQEEGQLSSRPALPSAPSPVHPPACATLRGCNRVVSLSLSALESDWKESSCPQACHRAGLGCCRDLACPPAVYGKAPSWSRRPGAKFCRGWRFVQAESFPGGKVHRAPSGRLWGGLLHQLPLLGCPFFDFSGWGCVGPSKDL